MPSQEIRLPSRKWSIVALTSASLAIVVVSYVLAIVVAVLFLLLPIPLLGSILTGEGSALFIRLLISAFGVTVGLSILWSLVPKKNRIDPNGVPIDLAKEPRLTHEIEGIATALREPMPTEVYLLPDANAFVMESAGLTGIGNRRIMGLGLPLLQMLSIAQFRAVLAHEFAHYYSGDTQLGPLVYSVQRAMVRMFENLGRKSEILRFLTRWAVVALLYRALMFAMSAYWKLFLRVTQAISRRQELRCDELACHVAGSQALIEGLENIRRVQPGVQSYWSSFVLPAAASGYLPALGEGFQRFMQAPQIAKAADELMAQAAADKTSPFDSHPSLPTRVGKARLLDIPTPTRSEADSISTQPMISLIDNLGVLEASLVKKIIPAAATDLKPLNLQTAGADIYIPAWRKQVAPFVTLLSEKKLSELPVLVLNPAPLAGLIPNPPQGRLNPGQRNARALSVLTCAFYLCLLENGWKLVVEPGSLTLENSEVKIDPDQFVSAMRSGKFSIVDWNNFRTQHGIGDWPLVSAVPSLVAT